MTDVATPIAATPIAATAFERVDMRTDEQASPPGFSLCRAVVLGHVDSRVVER